MRWRPALAALGGFALVAIGVGLVAVVLMGSGVTTSSSFGKSLPAVPESPVGDSASRLQSTSPVPQAAQVQESSRQTGTLPKCDESPAGQRDLGVGTDHYGLALHAEVVPSFAVGAFETLAIPSEFECYTLSVSRYPDGVAVSLDLWAPVSPEDLPPEGAPADWDGRARLITFIVRVADQPTEFERLSSQGRYHEAAYVAVDGTSTVLRDPEIPGHVEYWDPGRQVVVEVWARSDTEAVGFAEHLGLEIGRALREER